VTAKQAAAELRKHLNHAADGGIRRWTSTEDGSEKFTLSVPTGLRFDVRATKKGNINVTTRDGGYVDAVTEGDRRAFDYDKHGQAVVETVLAFERFMFGEEVGEVKWGPILISATAYPTDTVRIGAEESAS
jgi:hypothetical protein